MQHLAVGLSTCNGRTNILSFFNYGRYPRINKVYGLQAVANAVGKINAYASLVERTLQTNSSATMQALHDVLKGTVQDLYNMVSSNTVFTVIQELYLGTL